MYVYDDGGRKAAGFRGSADDCVCRAIAIATETPYREVYDALNEAADYTRRMAPKAVRRRAAKSNAREGVIRDVYEPFLRRMGWEWYPCMGIGTGCTVHLTPGDLPMGRIIVRVSKHMCAVVDGVVHDTYDSTRGGRRCVYGYWYKEERGE